ncbi:MAG: NAD(P)H-hydrate epimerase, partial [Kiritimatiellia bacterium]
MRFLTSSQIRTWDQRAIAERGVCGLSLMNRAGAAVARVVARVAAQGREQNVWLIAGRGNNGGDAFVAARCLHEDGFVVRVRMTCAPEALRGDARGAWEQMQQAGVPFRVWAEVSAWLADEGEDQPCGGVIVDGLLGTGSEG